MGPVSVAAVGWFMGSLINKVVMESLEAWANRFKLGDNRFKLGDEFETLKDQLLQLDDLLTDARSIRTNNRFLDELAQNLQKLAYQAENLLDELDYYRLQDEIQQRGTQEQENCSSSSSSGQLLAGHSIISTIEGLYIRSAPYAPVPLPKTSPSKINLSRRMNELAGQLQKSEDKLRKALQTGSLVNIARNTEICQTEETNLPKTSSFDTDTGEFVGRNEERDQLLKLLKNEESATVGKVLVVAIVGCGGVGKTTLAGLVFNDPNVESFFDVKSWICVSTRFNIGRLTREMLQGACGNSYDKLTNLEALQKKLKDELVSKRFLLVLDDMWEDKDKSEWNKLVALLNNCKVKRSIILVTTRNQSVAKMIDARNIYLHGLEEDAFLSFFSTCIFNDSNFQGNWRLRNIGQQIANKLKGNPLAAKTVSALLKENNDEGYWMEIRDNKEWKFQSDPNDIMPALRLSYEHMPFHLQRCFSYCAIFPEDHPFTSEELVYLWMAQGFLGVRSKGKRMEDIGEIYFKDLFNRGFFQTKQTNYGSAHYTFHDLIHDLACMVSDKECLSINGTEPRQTPPTIRHLSIFNSTERGEETIVRALEYLKGENLSTIINWDELSLGTFRSISDLLKETKFLRAVTLNLCLDVHQEYFNSQNFVSLRYLKLIVPINSTWTFPREICRLYHLEVFEIKGGSIVELPNNFSDLVSLRHFIASWELYSKIWGVGKLTSLQELPYFDVQQKEGFEIEQLGSLKEIRGSLRIRNLHNVKSKEEASKARLEEKEKLDTLDLEWYHGAQENESVLEGLKPSTKLRSLKIFGYGGVASPTWLEPSLILLESLTLGFCKAWELLPPIGELESLKCLRLIKLATREIGPQCYGTQQSMKFPSLEELEIRDMPNLEKWVWSDHLQQFLCFKKLKKLTIRNCPKLGDLPLSRCATSEVLERFPSLQSLIIHGCPLIFQLSPLPYSSRLYFISIEKSGVIESMRYNKEKERKLSLTLYQSSSVKVDELLAFHELSSLHFLKISHSFSLESLDFNSLVALETLAIEGCQSLASLTFGEHLRSLKIISCGTLRIKGLKSWVNLKRLHICKCPGIIAAWESASKEIQKLSSLRVLELSNISNLESLDLHSLVALESLVIEGCQSLASLTFGEHLVQLMELKIISCETLRAIEGLKSLVNLEWLHICECPGFIAAWDSASKEIEKLSSLRVLELSNISNLEYLDLHSLVALKSLVIEGCQSLASLTFGKHLAQLTRLKIISCETLRSIEDLKSWVNLKLLHIRKCPGFIAAWDSASKEIEKTEPDFSLSLTTIKSDSLALLTLPICRQLTSLRFFYLEFSNFTEEDEISPQLLTSSIDLVDITGCKNLQSFPFHLFPSLKELTIKFPRIEELRTNSRDEITRECLKLRNIKRVYISRHPVKIHFELMRLEEMICQHMDADN